MTYPRIDSFIAPESNPVFGITQPNGGMLTLVLSAGMSKRSKRPPPESLLNLRAALASNLRAHIAAKYGKAPQTAAAEEIGQITGIGKNTVLRALGKGSEEADIRLDTLVRLAEHFQVSATDLLQDYGRPPAPRPRRAATNPNERARTEGTDSETARASLQQRRRA
jgi:hypothetical protein